MIMDAWFDMVVNNILQVINSEHFEPFPGEPSNDAQGMEAWSINQFWKYFVKRQWETSTLQRCHLNENWEVQGIYIYVCMYTCIYVYSHIYKCFCFPISLLLPCFFMVVLPLWWCCQGRHWREETDLDLSLSIVFSPARCRDWSSAPGVALRHALGMSKNGVILGYARISMDVFHEDMDI